MKRILVGLGAFVGIIVLIGTIGMLVISNNMKTIQALEITELDLSNVEDGTYIGEYYYKDQIGVTLEIIVANYEITSITFIEHLYGKGDIAEPIVYDIIEYQSLMVDDVSGATTSSHVIKLAVQEAFKEE